MTDSIEYHKLGFCLSETGQGRLEVQKIDEPIEWAMDNGYDFVIPQLKSDFEAKEIAESLGVVFVGDTYVVKRDRTAKSKLIKVTFTRRYYKAFTTEVRIPNDLKDSELDEWLQTNVDMERIHDSPLDLEDEEIYVWE